jgi:hypothetical protein
VKRLLAAVGLIAALAIAQAQQAPADVGIQESPAQPMDWIEESLASPLESSGTATGKQEVLPRPMEWREEPLPSAGATTGAAAAAATGSRIGLSPQEQSVIHDALMGSDAVVRYPECRNAEQVAFTVGRPYPRTARICQFPDDVKAKLPKVQRYRYLVAGDAIVLIDPTDHHRIVDVLQ